MEKIETDMKRLVYFFYQGKYLKGRETIVVRGPIGKAAPAALTPSGETVQGQSLKSLEDMCALMPRGLGPSTPSHITPCK